MLQTLHFKHNIPLFVCCKSSLKNIQIFKHTCTLTLTFLVQTHTVSSPLLSKSDHFLPDFSCQYRHWSNHHLASFSNQWAHSTVWSLNVFKCTMLSFTVFFYAVLCVWCSPLLDCDCKNPLCASSMLWCTVNATFVSFRLYQLEKVLYWKTKDFALQEVYGHIGFSYISHCTYNSNCNMCFLLQGTYNKTMTIVPRMMVFRSIFTLMYKRSCIWSCITHHKGISNGVSLWVSDLLHRTSFHVC